MQIEFKIPKAHVCQDNACFKTTFVLVKNITDRVILGNPFMCLLYPFITDSEGITTHPFGQPVKFKFLRSPKPKDINSLKEVSISKTLNLIKAKTQHLKYLGAELSYKKVDEQLACKSYQSDIRKFEEELKREVCSDLLMGILTMAPGMMVILSFPTQILWLSHNVGQTTSTMKSEMSPVNYGKITIS